MTKWTQKDDVDQSGQAAFLILKAVLDRIGQVAFRVFITQKAALDQSGQSIIGGLKTSGLNIHPPPLPL